MPPGYHRHAGPGRLPGDATSRPTTSTSGTRSRDGQLLCHPQEREALANVLAWGLCDPFRERNPFADDFSRVTIHRHVPGWENPSDHAPVSVDLTR